MSAATAAAPLWVSIEGINGVGKTTAARAAASGLGPRCLLLDELTDHSAEILPRRVIGALGTDRDPFLRTGYPVVETLALLALQIRKAERLDRRHTAGVDVILEDRGVDTIAAYQAAILTSDHPETSPELVARHVLSTARRWRPLPDATILLTGDPSVCARRFADRIGHCLEPSDLPLIDQIDTLYRKMAADAPERYNVVDVADFSPEQSAAAVARIVNALLDQRGTHAA